MIESLEPRQLMAASSYLDTAWNGSGVSTLNFRTFLGDANITATQIVFAANGNTYVMARTKTTMQVRRLAANGTANTSFGKSGLLLVPLAGQTSSAKIAADSVGNLILLADTKIYRFDGQGKTLNANFATNGVLTLGDFTGDVDMSVDAANKIYVTGKTKNGKGILVDRFISRGKRDQTFNGSGQVTVPLPRVYRNLTNPFANGQFVQVVQDQTPADTTDDEIVVAGAASADHYSGIEMARIKYDGSFVPSYGNGGTEYLLGRKSNESFQTRVSIDAISEPGRVSVTATSADNPGLGGSTTVDTSIYMPNGIPVRNHQFSAGIAAPSDTEIDIINGGLSRVRMNQTVTDFNASGLTGINSIARYSNVDDDGQAILAASIAQKAGRVNVLKFLPTFVPVIS